LSSNGDGREFQCGGEPKDEQVLKLLWKSRSITYAITPIRFIDARSYSIIRFTIPKNHMRCLICETYINPTRSLSDLPPNGIPFAWWNFNLVPHPKIMPGPCAVKIDYFDWLACKAWNLVVRKLPRIIYFSPSMPFLIKMNC
jgi:hypothetical protein